MTDEYMEEKSTKYADTEAKISSALKRIVRDFSSAPFLFVGSGFSRRYMNTPSWEELLTHFAGIIRDDDPYIAFRYYDSQSEYAKTEDRLPCIASLLKSDFNKQWLGSKEFRSKNPLSDTESDPFNSAVAQYLGSFSWDRSYLKNEIDNFKNVCGSSIAGIITTNYDNLLEKLSGFVPYVGQSELLVSDPQGLAEIYKIHGSISKPDSLVLTKEDYDQFRSREQYLSAKLITIFMEHPIFFIGYSLQDPDILELIKTLIGCFDNTNKDKIQKFQDRLFFVSYEPESSPKISEYGLTYNGSNLLTMRKITVQNFDIIYKALLNYRQRISVKILRAFKKGFVEFTQTNEPNEFIQVMDIDNERISDKDLALFFGIKEHATQGLVGKSVSDLFMDIIYDDFGYTADEILYMFIPEKIKSNPGIPIFKYIANSSLKRPINTGIELKQNIEDFFPETNKNWVKNSPEERTFIEILNETPEDLSYALAKMMHVPYSRYTPENIRAVLLAIFDKEPNILKSKEKKTSNARSYIRKMIRVLDFLLYKERAMERLASIEQSTP